MGTSLDLLMAVSAVVAIDTRPAGTSNLVDKGLRTAVFGSLAQSGIALRHRIGYGRKTAKVVYVGTEMYAVVRVRIGNQFVVDAVENVSRLALV